MRSKIIAAALREDRTEAVPRVEQSLLNTLSKFVAIGWIRCCNKVLAELPPIPPVPQPDKGIKSEQPQTDWLERRKNHIKNTEFKEAVSACSTAIGKNGGANAFYLRAVAYSKMKDRQRMQAEIEAAAKLGHQKAIDTLKKMEAKAA